MVDLTQFWHWAAKKFDKTQKLWYNRMGTLIFFKIFNKKGSFWVNLLKFLTKSDRFRVNFGSFAAHFAQFVKIFN